jgi:Fur family ferric uptake transcriptional regulator
MICTECGRVIEFFSADIENLQDQMADKFGFRPTHHSLRMWGVCEDCQTKENELSNTPSGAQPKVRVRTAVEH